MDEPARTLVDVLESSDDYRVEVHELDNAWRLTVVGDQIPDIIRTSITNGSARHFECHGPGHITTTVVYRDVEATWLPNNYIDAPDLPDDIDEILDD